MRIIFWNRCALSVPLLFLMLTGTALLQSADPVQVEPAQAAKLREILSNAQQSMEKLEDYRVRLRRREVVAGRQCQEDVVMLTVRHKPFAVHIKCLPGGENEGREILYVPELYHEMLKVLTGKGDVLSGIRMDVSMKSDMATANSRRGLNEAGFANVIQRFGLAVDKYLAGQPRCSTFETLGLQTRAESRAPMEVVIQKIPAGEEALLPHGGIRYWHFSADADLPERHLPTLIITFDDKGQEVEYYSHDRVLPHITLDQKDFHADHLWSR
ncbi:MAG: DUF1571 domain-containing protein [Planctomycetia bacterium]|nr:DUF1571 domain-containing protein [Planctomycetia bacterium]